MPKACSFNCPLPGFASPLGPVSVGTAPTRARGAWSSGLRSRVSFRSMDELLARLCGRCRGRDGGGKKQPSCAAIVPQFYSARPQSVYFVAVAHTFHKQRRLHLLVG